MRHVASFALLPVVLFAAATWSQEAPAVNEQDPVLLFEKRYNFGAQAVLDKNWVDAHRHFETALAALGQREHIKKQAAQILFKKAQDESRKQRALFTANELLRLNQFKEAEEAFLAAQAELGDTAEIRQGLENVRNRREQEPKLRMIMQREKEFHLALEEAHMLQQARRLEQAREYAERARQLKPDDARALEIVRDIEQRMRGDRKAVGEQDPFIDKRKERLKPEPAPEKPGEKTGDF